MNYRNRRGWTRKGRTEGRNGRLERKLGTEAWNRSLEPKLGTEAWNRSPEPKRGTEARNRAILWIYGGRRGIALSIRLPCMRKIDIHGRLRLGARQGLVTAPLS